MKVRLKHLQQQIPSNLGWNMTAITLAKNQAKNRKNLQRNDEIQIFGTNISAEWPSVVMENRSVKSKEERTCEKVCEAYACM